MDLSQFARKGRNVILGVLPPEPVFATYHRLARRRFLDYGQRKLGVDFRYVAPGASPPRELVAKTSASNEKQLQLESNPDKYFGGGYRMVLNWLRVLEHISFNIRTVGAVLELGCGTARLIRHFRCLDGVRLVGTDLNPEMIEWCSANVPGIEFHCNDLQPPLPLANDAAFDLNSGIFGVHAYPARPSRALAAGDEAAAASERGLLVHRPWQSGETDPPGPQGIRGTGRGRLHAARGRGHGGDARNLRSAARAGTSIRVAPT